MLSYLSGVKLPFSKKAAPAAGPQRKINVPLVKKIVSESPSKAPALKKSPLIKAAVRHDAIIKKIAVKSPLTAIKLKKAAIEQARRQDFEQAEEPLIKQPSRIPSPEFSDENTAEPEYTESEEGTDYEESEDSQESEDLGSLGIYGLSGGKRAAKKQQKKLDKQAVKAAKPKNVAKQTKAEAKKIKAEKGGGGAGKEIVKKLIDTGASIVKSQIPGMKSAENKEPDGPPPESEKGFFSNIPTPVKVVGGTAIFLGIAAAAGVFKKRH